VLPPISERWRHFLIVVWLPSLSCLNVHSALDYLRISYPTLRPSWFSDASTAAFAVAVYLRIININDSITLFLLAAKSKVAPLKTISVPWLGLSAALLLACLMHFTLSAPTFECHCWTDSTIHLAESVIFPMENFCRQSRFAVQLLLPEVSWRHVPTHTNPADCASRSRSQFFLDTCSMMVKPSMVVSFFRVLAKLVPFGTLRCSSRTTLRTLNMCLARYANWDLASRYSSWPKLLRTTIYMYRFLNRFRRSKNLSEYCDFAPRWNSEGQMLAQNHGSQSCFLMRSRL